MFRTTIKSLYLFRQNNSYSYSHNAFKKKEQPTLYNDAVNMFMKSAFVKESINNTNTNTNTNTNSQEFKYSDNNETELKMICQITGLEKNRNNKDCSCDKICIVQKSEISMICDLL
jgi:hypothetical protein